MPPRSCFSRWIAPNPVTEELYDLTADPIEARHLAADPRSAADLAIRRDRWEFFRRELK